MNRPFGAKVKSALFEWRYRLLSALLAVSTDYIAMIAHSDEMCILQLRFAKIDCHFHVIVLRISHFLPLPPLLRSKHNMDGSRCESPFQTKTCVFRCTHATDSQQLKLGMISVMWMSKLINETCLQRIDQIIEKLCCC